MSYAHPARATRIPGGDQGRRQWIDEEALEFAQQAPYLNTYHDGLNNFVAESWLSETNTWSSASSAQKLWSHDASQVLLPFVDGAGLGKPLYNGIEQHALNYENDHPNLRQYIPKPVSRSEERIVCQPQPHIHAINQVASSYRTAYQSQTPQESQNVSPSNEHMLYSTSSNMAVSEYSHLNVFSAELRQEHSSWPVSYSEPQGFDTTSSLSPDINVSTPSSPTLKLDWSSSKQPSSFPSSHRELSHPPHVPKRKRESPQPVSKKSRSETPQRELSEFVLVFENAPGALASVKHRRKLDAPVRKAARDVRKAGACHQCRFRKRTCSTGTPCMSCLKNGNGLHEIKCQRESPFVGKLMHQYFEHSSTRRIVSFDIKIRENSLATSKLETVTIDGVGHLSLPVKLKVQRKLLSDFTSEEQKIIRQTEEKKKGQKNSKADPESVIILTDNGSLGQEVEQWAVEYTSKFVHAAGPDFYATTMAQILGTAYVKKRLPESALVGAMLRVASLAFVLRAGVKCSESQLSSRFRTIQAMIDTILYERLIVAEKELFQMLQRLIFRTAGCLNRESIYPVALVLWQLMRILSISTGHLSNIAQRFHPKVYGPADYQLISFRLLLSTHMALFRSSNPLLLDLNEKLHQDLLSNDEELLELAEKMRNVVLTFRNKGTPEIKGSIVYKKEYFEMFRKVYEGM
ncbi:hypothetical protein LSUE1_G008368 [Lachnellula suecica]|uniref:Zn(2)-C6 fungal-type domain-containing protein n=1 Tax=Lachnellula suecica TaxID=602035 RepID=A0A8T9CCK3_9HELO|nr:hypothetical protein LSUE1_G008368 [Lachnellula suecica]